MIKRLAMYLPVFAFIFIFQLIALGDEFEFRHHFADPNLPGDAYGQTSLVDIDRDGDLDFVTGRRGGDIYWYEYKSADTWVRHLLGVESASDVGGASCDIDGDGWVDFVTGGVWYRNLGRSRNFIFTRHVFDESLEAVHDLIIADVNGDGIDDVVTMSDQNSLRWYRVSDDPFSSWHKTEIGESVHAGITSGDIDGDGDLDIVRSNAWFENGGAGESWTKHVISAPWGRDMIEHQRNATMTQVLDVDGNGRLDILLVECENRGARIAWLSAGIDPRDEWHVYELTPAGEVLGALHSLKVADFNDDDLLDFVTVEMEWVRGAKSPRWWLFVNQGEGEFVPEVILDANLGGHETEIGDVDGDGDLDLCSKLWRPMEDNGNGGANHFSFLENLKRQKGNR